MTRGPKFPGGKTAVYRAAPLHCLAHERREVIVAHHWGGLSFEQIEPVIGCSASTAFRRYTAGVGYRIQLGVVCPKNSSNA